MDLEPLPAGRLRPTPADQKAFQNLQATALDRALADARVWRNGYALLGSGIGAVLALVGTRLEDATPWGWRLALSATLGGGLVAVAIALWQTLTIEGGRRATQLHLASIVERHNSFELYQVDQALAAINRLDQSKTLAVIGAGLSFLGVLCTLWMASPAPDTPSPQPAASATASGSRTNAPSSTTPSSSATPQPTHTATPSASP